MRQEYIQEYIDLIERFLQKKLSAKIFEGNFLDLFNDDANDLNGSAFDIIESLFFQVDAYTDLPMEPTDNPDDYINEEQLRERAFKTLQELRLSNNLSQQGTT